MAAIRGEKKKTVRKKSFCAINEIRLSGKGREKTCGVAAILRK